MGDTAWGWVFIFIVFGLFGSVGIAAFVGLVAVVLIVKGLKLVFRSAKRLVPPAPVHRCPDCHTAMNPVTCMTCGPARVPDTIPVHWKVA